MQQIFCCPTCGAQNVVGQEFCQSCGQPFQYNCPFCGAIVDSKFVNCPRCRESLNWPTPQKVKPFPKQPVAYQRRGGGGEVGEGEEKAKKKKSNPWITGCLGLVIIGILFMVAYLVYDYIRSQSAGSQLPLSPGVEVGFKPMQSPGLETLSDPNEMQT
jgi:uncharacterized membrane protein YvbJ